MRKGGVLQTLPFSKACPFGGVFARCELLSYKRGTLGSIPEQAQNRTNQQMILTMKKLIKEMAVKVPIVGMWCSCLPNWDEYNIVERILIAFIGCVCVDVVRWGLRKE